MRVWIPCALCQDPVRHGVKLKARQKSTAPSARAKRATTLSPTATIKPESLVFGVPRGQVRWAIFLYLQGSGRKTALAETGRRRFAVADFPQVPLFVHSNLSGERKHLAGPRRRGTTHRARPQRETDNVFQFPEGLSTWSMTTVSNRAVPDSSLKPRSWMALANGGGSLGPAISSGRAFSTEKLRVKS